MIASSVSGRPSAYAIEQPVSEAGALEAVMLCVERGVDVHAFNANGQTALHFAAARGADSIVRCLAERGAKLDLENEQGRAPLELAEGRGGGGRGGPAPVRQRTAALLRELMERR